MDLRGLLLRINRGDYGRGKEERGRKEGKGGNTRLGNPLSTFYSTAPCGEMKGVQ